MEKGKEETAGEATIRLIQNHPRQEASIPSRIPAFLQPKQARISVKIGVKKVEKKRKEGEGGEGLGGRQGGREGREGFPYLLLSELERRHSVMSCLKYIVILFFTVLLNVDK